MSYRLFNYLMNLEFYTVIQIKKNYLQNFWANYIIFF